MAEFEVGKRYSFNLLSSAMYARIQTDLKCAASGCDVKTARLMTPIDQEYAAILPSLPVQNQINIEDAVFYIFETNGGERRVFAKNTIATDSIEVVEWVSFDIRVENTSLEAMEKVRHAMAAAGIQDYTITRR